MQTFFQILMSAIAGTVVMTAFSHLVSAAFGKLFSEPLLLQRVLLWSGMEAGTGLRRILGWVVHLLFGVIFVVLYHLLWRMTGVTVFNVMLLGAASGIAGILGWMLLFRIPGKKPRVDYKNYYRQLFVAHLFFTATAALVYMSLA